MESTFYTRLQVTSSFFCVSEDFIFCSWWIFIISFLDTWFLFGSSISYIRKKLVIEVFFDCQRLLDRVEIVKKLLMNWIIPYTFSEPFIKTYTELLKSSMNFFTTSTLSKSCWQSKRVSATNYTGLQIMGLYFLLKSYGSFPEKFLT